MWLDDKMTKPRPAESFQAEVGEHDNEDFKETNLTFTFDVDDYITHLTWNM